MSDLRTAAQQALEALEYENSWHEFFKVRPYASTVDAITALRAALAQQDEPDHETRAELAEQQVVQLAEERDHFRNLWQKAQQAEPAQDQRCRAEPRSDGDFVCDCKIGDCFGRSAALAQQAEPVEPVATLIAQRDALLEALRALVRNEGLDAYSYLDKGIGTATAAGKRWLNARAAIKAVEEQK